MFSPGHSEVGGCSRRSRLLAEELAERGWAVIAICRTGSAYLPRVTRRGNLVAIDVPGFRTRLGVVLYLILAFLAGLALGFRARFVSVQLSSPSLVAGLCARIFRRPFVAFSSSSGEVSEIREILESPIRSNIHARILQGASFLVAQTPDSAEELQVFVGPERVKIIHNPMPPLVDAPLTGEPHALYTGRFAAEKDLPILLSAWTAVADKHPDARLTLVGAGGDYRSVEDELRSLVGDSDILARTVTFTGWVSNVADYLHASDVYVFPSRSEGLSNALLEACAWGRIIVASNIPPNRVILGDDYPLLFPAGDVRALTSTLLAALEHQDVRDAAWRIVHYRARELSSSSAGGQLEELLLTATTS